MATAELTRTRHFLRVSDVDASELELLLELAEDMKEERRSYCETLRTETVAMFFEKPSTRTRSSFAAAAYRLGAMPLVLRPDELQLGRGEPIADTARVLSSYASAIVIRTFAQSELEEVAANASVPVINALSDAHHPCQALADLLTVRERFGSLRGRRLAFVGDGNNVAHSLIEAGALSGMQIAIATPPGYEPDAGVVEGARQRASENGAILLLHDPVEAVVDADVVYTDVWVSMGEDEERRERLHDLGPYQVTAELMRRAKVDAIFLHCLPAHRGEEVTAEVIDGPRSLVWQQAANRLPTEQALLYALVTGSWHPPGKRE
jgi:ornithine carbamoyltransferase